MCLARWLTTNWSMMVSARFKTMTRYCNVYNMVINDDISTTTTETGRKPVHVSISTAISGRVLYWVACCTEIIDLLFGRKMVTFDSQMLGGSGGGSRDKKLGWRAVGPGDLLLDILSLIAQRVLLLSLALFKPPLTGTRRPIRVPTYNTHRSRDFQIFKYLSICVCVFGGVGAVGKKLLVKSKIIISLSSILNTFLHLSVILK